MANQTPEDDLTMPEEIPWNCLEDGHEFERKGEYDPDTNSDFYLECIHCGHTEPYDYDGEADLDYDDSY